MILKKINYIPNLAIHPGETLKENLELLKISNKELSTRTGLTEKHISQIVNGEASITADTSIKLEKATGIDALFWNNLQANYEIILSQIKAKENIQEEIKLSEKYNYLELSSYNLVISTRDKITKVSELQKYFQVSSLEFVPQVTSVAFRNANSKLNPHSLSAWLRFGEIKFLEIKDVNEFDEKKLVDSIPKMKSLISKKNFFMDLQKICAESGVVLVHTPYFKNIKVNGSVRWYKENPLIQINSKGSYSDTFWFTFFHEIGHIVLHSKKDKFVDYDGLEKDEKEKEADKYASDILIPEGHYSEIITRKNLSVEDLKKFCKLCEVSISVVVGRFAHDKLIPWPIAARFREKLIID